MKAILGPDCPGPDCQVPICLDLFLLGFGGPGGGFGGPGGGFSGTRNSGNPLLLLLIKNPPPGPPKPPPGPPRSPPGQLEKQLSGTYLSGPVFAWFWLSWWCFWWSWGRF